jgi:SAM-dependent methyltransferase
MKNNIIDVFTKIYNNDGWGNGSGPGSYAENNKEYTKALIEFIQAHNIKTILDYGCGDWQFSRFIPWDKITEKYTGVDVVESVIKNNQINFTKENIKFEKVDSSWTWPMASIN